MNGDLGRLWLKAQTPDYVGKGASKLLEKAQLLRSGHRHATATSRPEGAREQCRKCGLATHDDGWQQAQGKLDLLWPRQHVIIPEDGQDAIAAEVIHHPSNA